MAWRGSLEDIRVRDLLQVLRTGGRTGELVVAGLEADARLYFQDGALVEAVGGGRSGVGVLTDTLSWNNGEFEFRPEAEAPSRPDLELQSAVARVLAFPGTLTVVPSAADLTPTSGAPTTSDSRCAPLSAFVATVPFAEYACIQDATGVIRAQSGSSLHPMAQMCALAAAVNAFRLAHPRPELHRMLVEDDRGVVAVTRLGDGSMLMVVADGDAGLGNESAAVTKLAHQLEASQ